MVPSAVVKLVSFSLPKQLARMERAQCVQITAMERCGWRNRATVEVAALNGMIFGPEEPVPPWLSAISGYYSRLTESLLHATRCIYITVQSVHARFYDRPTLRMSLDDSLPMHTKGVEVNTPLCA